MSIYATNECISGLMDQLSELTKKRDALKAEIERLRADAALGRAGPGCAVLYRGDGVV